MKKVNKILVIVLMLLLALSVVIGCGQSNTSDGNTTTQTSDNSDKTTGDNGGEVITWRFVSAFVPKAAEHYGFWMFADRINEELGDRLKIEYLGGTEIVAYFDQFEQLGKGVFEIGHIPVNMTENIVPTGDALYLTELNPMEMRESGAYDMMKKNYAEQGNVVYLGVTSGENYGYTIFTNFEVNSLADFKGKTIRTAPVFVPLLEALGAGSVSIGAGEIYQAVERGVVDGFGWSTLGVTDYAWEEVIKYRIDPIFYPCNIGIFVNKDAFDALPADLQEEVLRIAREVEAECYAKQGDMVIEELRKQEEGGIKPIVLEGETRQQWLDTAKSAGWAHLEKLDPEGAAAIKPLVTKSN